MALVSGELQIGSYSILKSLYINIATSSAHVTANKISSLMSLAILNKLFPVEIAFLVDIKNAEFLLLCSNLSKSYL